MLLVGENPLRGRRHPGRGRVRQRQDIAYTLFYATNFIFTGLAVAVAFHAGLFNIGGEGQAYIAGLGVALVCLPLDLVLPWWLTFPLAIARRRRFGAAWAFIPAYLQAKRGSHIVITTIMFNFIAAALMVYLLVDVLKPAGVDGAADAHLPRGRQLPKLSMGCSSVFGLTIRSAPLNISLPAGAGHGLAGLGADLAHQARLRDAHHRPQPEGGRLCRHRGDPHHHHHHDDLGRRSPA